ncbi:MAG: ubiquinone biosynthesis protein UbiH [Burkholderiales bacterium RIFCSPLOWO2_12_67_14]|nr:MAG: ubiquinone biosynthesis protein UbiH [Burkholderiales bacterium RIFCSPLOWO2_02_FULL_67_64]OGB45814.1 MAG: ubiquinone biosynthesis protein UbiH [Burkholderiales bacterium RIFCSPHIGHO2_12_FULL_67_38]OGB51182.1 MAG: ubiquinone biosynthesis protein UbiH [Burkholderiales bacterium RIFCSPLOWO2_12_67_14]OGB86280.1 MAG: ubiquinone biosynthesis protein UbiH [Burkholderiales bacterium RIFCSPLOWO2_12_FULL_67_210]
MSQASPRSTHRRFDVTIRGGGVVGHTLALLLARDRLRVALVGAPSRPATGGADVRAYALNAAARDLLRSVRAWPEDALAPAGARAADAPPAITPVTGMEVFGDGRGELRFGAADQGTDALTWIVDVPALELRLAHAVHFQGGIECLSEAPPAALTVICEGKRSATRAELGMEFEVRPYPHKALATRLRCARPHGGVARQWFRNGEIMALLPLGGAQGNSVALVWSLETQQADAWLAAAPDALAQAVQERCGQALGEMHLESPAQAWPLELARATRWIARTAQGGVALAGDAAHAMHPLAGQGLNVGLADAAELARVLHEREYWRELGDLKLLRRYERARQADVNAMAWVTDGLFGLFAQTDSRIQSLRNWGMQGVDRLGPLKHWLARQAMGQAG